MKSLREVQIPSWVSSRVPPGLELYSLLLWGAQLSHASYPREQLLNELLCWFVAVYKSFLEENTQKFYFKIQHHLSEIISFL